jgi:hypothetical protein
VISLIPQNVPLLIWQGCYYIAEQIRMEMVSIPLRQFPEETIPLYPMN